MIRGWLLARMRAREWFAAPPADRGYPGRRVRLAVGPLVIERFFGAPLGFRVRTGRQVERMGWWSTGARPWLVVAWPHGCLSLGLTVEREPAAR